MLRHFIKLHNATILIGIIVLFYSCRNKVTITQDYIYSSGWAHGEYQGFRIAKIKLEDNSISVHDQSFNKYSLSEYTVDSNFCFGAGGNSSTVVAVKKMPKIYFDKESKHHIWYKCFNIEETYKTIGTLQTNTWYIITGLHGTEDFFVYIDKDGSSYTYGLGPTNW
jgi:hypothetical protein